MEDFGWFGLRRFFVNKMNNYDVGLWLVWIKKVFCPTGKEWAPQLVVTTLLGEQLKRFLNRWKIQKCQKTSPCVVILYGYAHDCHDGHFNIIETRTLTILYSSHSHHQFYKRGLPLQYYTPPQVRWCCCWWYFGKTKVIRLENQDRPTFVQRKHWWWWWWHW